MLKLLRATPTLILFLLINTAAFGAFPDELNRQLENAFNHKDLRLKVPASGAQLEYSADGTRVQGEPGVYGLDDRFSVTKIELHDHALRIRAKRIVLLINRDDPKKDKGISDEVEILIAQPDGEPNFATVTATLQRVLATQADTAARQCAPEEAAVLNPYKKPDRKFKVVLREHAEMACLPTGGRGYVIGKDIRPPKPKLTPDPTYPPGLKAKRGETTVVFFVRVDEQGSITDVLPVSSPGLSEAFAECGVLRRWKLEPAIRAGSPVPVIINIEMNFRLY